MPEFKNQSLLKNHHYNDDVNLLTTLSNALSTEYCDFCKTSGSAYFFDVLKRINNRSVQESPYLRLLILLIFFSIDSEDFFGEYELLVTPEEDMKNVDYDSNEKLKKIKKYFSYDLLRHHTNHKAIVRFYHTLAGTLCNREHNYNHAIDVYMKNTERKIINDNEASILINYNQFISFFKSFFEEIRPIHNKKHGALSDDCYYTTISPYLFLDYHIVIARHEFIADIIDEEHIKNYPLLHNNNIFAEKFNLAITDTLFNNYDKSPNLQIFLISLCLNWDLYQKIFNDKVLLNYLITHSQSVTNELIVSDEIKFTLSNIPSLQIMERAVYYAYLLNYQPYNKQRISKSKIQNFVEKSLQENSSCFCFYLDHSPTLLNLTKQNFISLFYYACSLI